MNKEELTNEALILLLKWAEGAEDFVTEQAPLVASEYIQYFLATSYLSLAFSFLILGTFITGSVLLWKSGNKASTDKRYNHHDFSPRQVWRNFGSAMLLIGLAISLPLIYNSMDDIVKGHIAPRVVVMDWIK